MSLSVRHPNTVADATDFRPDYKKLGSLKTLFPNVPIQAVVSTSSTLSYDADLLVQTATLSTKTMPDLLKILRLPPICDGGGKYLMKSPLMNSGQYQGHCLFHCSSLSP